MNCSRTECKTFHTQQQPHASAQFEQSLQIATDLSADVTNSQCRMHATAQHVMHSSPTGPLYSNSVIKYSLVLRSAQAPLQTALLIQQTPDLLELSKLFTCCMGTFSKGIPRGRAELGHVQCPIPPVLHAMLPGKHCTGTGFRQAYSPVGLRQHAVCVQAMFLCTLVYITVGVCGYTAFKER